MTFTTATEDERQKAREREREREAERRREREGARAQNMLLRYSLADDDETGCRALLLPCGEEGVMRTRKLHNQVTSRVVLGTSQSLAGFHF